MIHHRNFVTFAAGPKKIPHVTPTLPGPNFPKKSVIARVVTILYLETCTPGHAFRFRWRRPLLSGEQEEAWIS